MVNPSELSPNVNSLDISIKTRAESLIEKLVIYSAIMVPCENRSECSQTVWQEKETAVNDLGTATTIKTADILDSEEDRAVPLERNLHGHPLAGF